MTNVVTSTLPGGFVKISGNFFVGTLQFPDDPNSIYIGTLYTTFQRNITWNGLSDAILVRIEDLGCTPSFVKTFNPRYNIFPQFVDLTPLATNSLFNLVISGILPECALGSGQLDAVLIDDELIIDTDYCFDNLSSPNITMAFKPGAKITIKSGYTLTINRMNLITCGDQLAQGIVVESGATLIMNNCVISDCLNAIDASDGATIALRSNTFIDNYIGLKLLMQYKTRVNILALENNIFTSSDAGLKSPTDKMSPSTVETRGYCGIYLQNYRDFNVFGDADPTIPNGNTFSNLANGIIGLGNVSGNIGNMVFENILSIGTSVYGLSGNGIYISSANSKSCFMNINEPWTNMTFNNCNIAINMFGAAGNVEHTTITNTRTGINWSHSKTRDILIDGNQITASLYGIRSFMDEPLLKNSAINKNTITITGKPVGRIWPKGMEINEGGLSSDFNQSGWYFLDNTVTMNKGGVGIDYSDGHDCNMRGSSITNLNLSQTDFFYGLSIIGASSCEFTGNTIFQSANSIDLTYSNGIRSNGGWANLLACNCVNNTDIGLQFFDMADLTDLIIGNSMNTHTTGLRLGYSGISNVFIGQQHNTGNTWDLAAIPFGEYGGEHWGASSGSIGASAFFVDGAENAAFNPPVDPDSDWFIDLSTPEATEGCSGLACNFPRTPVNNPVKESATPTAIDLAIVNGTLPYDVFPTETQWKGAYRLYRKMLRQPAMEQYATVFATFKTTNSVRSTGKLAYVAEEKSKLFNQDANQGALTDANWSNVRTTMHNLWNLDSLRQLGTMVSQSQYDYALQQRINAQANIDNYLNGLDSVRQIRIQYLKQLNDGINTTLTIDYNQKVVNGILLNLLSTDSITSSELTILSAIADQCPLSGGDAVYEARAVVVHYTGEEYDDRQICAGTGSRENEQVSSTENKNYINIFPNPSTGLLSWSGITGPVTVRIFNQLGQLQLEQRCTEGSINLTPLQDGVYQLQLLDAGQLKATRSVVLMKH